MVNAIYIALEYFLVYSFLGWCTEVAYQAVRKGIVVNRGFLNGPVCPIYGFGVLSAFGLLEVAGEGSLYEQNAIKIFLFGLVLATLIEFSGGWILDKLFHARWWDYSDQPFNIHGYICLEFSIIWGLGILLVVRAINPTISHTLTLVPMRIGWIFLMVSMAVLIADLVVSVLVMTGLNRRMAEIDEARERMRIVSNGLSERIGSRALETAQQLDEAKVQAALARSEAKDRADKMRSDYEDRKRELEAKRSELIRRIQRSRHFGLGRMLRAFPDMKHREHSELLNALKESLAPRSDDESKVHDNE